MTQDLGQLGKYRIFAEIRKGGFATVYLALEDHPGSHRADRDNSQRSGDHMWTIEEPACELPGTFIAGLKTRKYGNCLSEPERAVVARPGCS